MHKWIKQSLLRGFGVLVERIWGCDDICDAEICTHTHSSLREAPSLSGSLTSRTILPVCIGVVTADLRRLLLNCSQLLFYFNVSGRSSSLSRFLPPMSQMNIVSSSGSANLKLHSQVLIKMPFFWFKALENPQISFTWEDFNASFSHATLHNPEGQQAAATSVLTVSIISLNHLSLSEAT